MRRPLSIGELAINFSSCFSNTQDHLSPFFMQCPLPCPFIHQSSINSECQSMLPHPFHVLNVVPRYRIKLRVIDHLDYATFVDFDRDASAFLKKTCSEMVDLVNKTAGASGIPKEILDIVDQTFHFKVEIRNGVNKRFEHSYRVKKICADEVSFKNLWLNFHPWRLQWKIVLLLELLHRLESK